MSTDNVFRKEIAAEVVMDMINYNPETGEVSYKRPDTMCLAKHNVHNGWVSRNVGRIASSVNNKGYITMTLLGEPYLAHRIAWVYMTGSQPNGQIDHIDGDKTNNRWVNLRECTNQENCKNQKLRATNKSGITGVRRNTDKYGKAWVVAIGSKYLGQFDDFFEAICARKSAENKLQYHANHGRATI